MSTSEHFRAKDHKNNIPVAADAEYDIDGNLTAGPLPVTLVNVGGGSTGSNGGSTGGNTAAANLALANSGVTLVQIYALLADILVELRVQNTTLREGLETSDSLDFLRTDENRAGSYPDA